MSLTRILIVDDDREDAELLNDAVMEILPTAESRIAQSASAAFMIVDDFHPHIVFLDSVMYPVGGKELLREFSALPQLAGAQFIVMSGVILPEQREEFTALGANFVMTKPSNYVTLLGFVEHILAASIINIRVKLVTSDNIIHNQTAALETLLQRDINFEISLNGQPMQQNVQFVVSQNELRRIHSELGYNLLCLSGGHWLPNI